MRIALIGTRGVPARYGGFETCVEEVGSRLAARGHDVLVFCRPTYDVDEPVTPLTAYKGMRLVQLPIVRRRSIETLLHTALSVCHRSLGETDAAIVFNAANSPLLPVLRARRIPVATHVDGLEWLRAKWGVAGRRYYRLAERMAVRWSDSIIADARGIADYYLDEFGTASSLIAYGAPIVTATDPGRLEELDLSPGKYHLVVARFEPENHVLDIVRGYEMSGAELPLVVVGSAPYADAYTAEIRAVAGPRVRLLGGVWDQEQLDQLYNHALTYLHGHSVGGTNPSLLRATGAGTFTIAFDVAFNREVLGDGAAYFSSVGDVARGLLAAESDPAATTLQGARLQRAVERYNWDDVTDRYEALCEDLAARVLQPSRGRGRRIGGSSTSRGWLPEAVNHR
jgi:glycosyltransferase involved in cell wall biosynthesis